MRRVAITGIGLVTAVGEGVEAAWKGLVEGRSGVGPIRSFDASSLRTQIGGEVPDFAPEKYIANRRTLRMMTRNDQLAVGAATLAVQDSGVDFSQDPERAGLFIGGNKEISDPGHVQEACLVCRREDGTVDLLKFGEVSGSTVYPLFYVEGLQAASLFYVSQAYGLKGANTYFAGTADSGMTAIGRGYRAIRRGEADVCLAGGFDEPVGWWNMSSWDGLGILTQRNDLGAGACRPFDRHRTGDVLGDGAVFLLLEEYGAASRRGARIYAEVTGLGSAYDPYGLVTPDPEGEALARALRTALKEAGASADQVGYVAAHGNGTRRGDASEARALHKVFEGSADRVAGSSVKPATGDLGAAAGALNAAVAALALHHRLAPPTLNLETPDPACRFGWVTRQAREIDARQAVAVARGLTGQNVVLALKAA